jgi:hypothetical protein
MDPPADAGGTDQGPAWQRIRLIEIMAHPLTQVVLTKGQRGDVSG